MINKFFRIIKMNYKHIGKLSTELTGAIFALLGIISTFAPLSDLFASELGLYIRVIISILILICVWMIAFVLNCLYICINKRFVILDAGNEHHVYLQYGNVFSENEVLRSDCMRSIVIPVNRCFDTIIDDDLISSNTLHGIAMKKLYADGTFTEETLNDEIKSYLKSRKIKAEKTLPKDKKRSGNLERYPVGTVAEIRVSEKVKYFFFGLTWFDQELHANTSIEDYVLASIRLLEFCNKRSQGFPVVIPLIGTGAANTQREAQMMLEYFVKLVKMNKSLINCDIHIVIKDGCKDEIGIAGIK